MPSDHRVYLNQPVREKMPVGKVINKGAHMFDGSAVTHKIFKDDAGIWHPNCAPTKEAQYGYMGFLVAVTCTRCKTRKGGSK